MDRRARKATVHGVTESDTTEQLNTHAHIVNTTLTPLDRAVPRPRVPVCSQHTLTVLVGFRRGSDLH